MDNITPPEISYSSVPESTPSSSPLKNKKLLIIIAAVIALILLIVATVMFFLLGKSNPTSTNPSITPSQTANNTESLVDLKLTAPSDASIIVYGYWAGSKTHIESFNIATGETTTIAELPSNIKKVSVLPNGDLLYINDTNEEDHGKSIVRYSVADKRITPIYTAPVQFGIDDYVLSNNQEYIAIWQVSFPTNQDQLLDGRSQVVAQMVQPNAQSYMLYNEVASTPVHYPRAVLDDGTVITDKFLPNNGAGWAYGMSTSSLNGEEKANIASMANGTYATQPTLSPDGKYLVFAGYDGSEGSGAEVVNGFRRALLFPNTVEYLDTTTLQRTKLPVSPENIYSYTDWNNDGTEILYGQYNVNTGGAFNSYNLISKQITPFEQENLNTVLKPINDTYMLVGTPNESAQFLGNLGKNYAPSLTSLAVLNTTTGQTIQVPVKSTAVQFIQSLLISSSNVLGLSTVNSAYAADRNQQLQLQTFEPKTSLAPQRATQQSKPLQTTTTQPTNSPSSQPTAQPENLPPTCDQLIEAQCNVRCNGISDCVLKCGHERALDIMNAGQASGACYDSPLYLYGPDGKSVDITIQTETKSPKNYSVILDGVGNFISNGVLLKSLEYDYQPGIRVRQPHYGTIVSKQNLAETVKWYAQKLGLNQKETTDLINKAVSQTTKPYVMVSFYNQEISKQILPLSFTPEPDTYINYVFYFKGLNSLPQYTLQAPVFPEIPQRGEFTAVEISEIFDSE